MRKREYPRHHWPFRASKVPSQPTGWSAQTHPRGVSPIPALEVCHFIRLNEALEHLVRKHAPAQSEANKIFRALQKSVVDQLCNRAAEIIDRRLAELSGQIPQVDTSREAQSKKEAFFQRSLPRHNSPMQRRSGNVLLQRIGGCEPNSFPPPGAETRLRLFLSPCTPQNPPLPIPHHNTLHTTHNPQ